MIIDRASSRVLKANVSGSLRLGVFLTAAMASLAYGQTILIDDFNDGNDDGWTRIDLIEDAPHGPAIFDASSGEYHLASTGANEDPRSFNQFGTAWNASVDPLYSNGFLRTTIRINEPFAGGSLALRVSGLDSLPSLDALNMYRFSAFYNGVGETASGFVFDRFEAGEVTYSQFAQLGGFTLDEDWMLEAGVVGGELSMKFWVAGEAALAEPQWTWTDPNPLGAGMIGLLAGNNFIAVNPVFIDASFDDIQFTPVGAANDCNADLVVDIADTLCATSETIGDILAAANLIQGDADGDGQVAFADYLALSTNFGQDGNYQQGNFDLLGGVEFADFLILSNNFGQTTEMVASVPEPTAPTLLAIRLMAFVTSRRRTRTNWTPVIVVELLSQATGLFEHYGRFWHDVRPAGARDV